MVVAEIITIVLGTIALTTAIIIQVRLHVKTTRMDVTANAPFLENLHRARFTDGYYMGVIKKQLPRKNGTTLIEFFPIDAEQGEYKPIPKIQRLIVLNEYIKRFARGEASSRREIVKLVSRNPADLPEKLRDTTEGKWMEKEAQKGFLLSTFKKFIPAGDEAMAELQEHFARGQMTRSALSKLREENNEMRKLIFKTPESAEVPKDKK